MVHGLDSQLKTQWEAEDYLKKCALRKKQIYYSEKKNIY